MTHDDIHQRQHALLAQLLALLQADPRVLGVAATGSYARGEEDAFSVLDIACYLRDEARTGRERLHEQVAALAPALAVLYLYDVHGLYLYADGTRLDLDYLRPDDIRDESPTVRIRFDPDGALARDLGRAYRPAPPAHPGHWQPGDPTYVTWFLWMFRQAYCWAKRGAQGSDRAFHKLAGAADSLHQIRTSLMAMRLWTLGADEYLSRLDPGFTGRLARTYPHLLPEELLAATRALLAEYERVCPAYCQRAGVPYPAEQVAAVHRCLTEFDQLR